MNFEIVELEEFSGSNAGIYSILIEDEEHTLFDQFVEENEVKFFSELESITDRLEIIGNFTGARDQYFKLHEGAFGDDICALYDSPDKKLRLYCIRYGATCIILGGGGSKNVRALQDDEKLKKENYLLRKISIKITESLRNKDLYWNHDGTKLEGNFFFED